MKLIAASCALAAVAAVPKGHGDHGKGEKNDMMGQGMSGGQLGNNLMVDGQVFINNGQASYGMAMGNGMDGKNGRSPMGGKNGKPMGGMLRVKVSLVFYIQRLYDHFLTVFDKVSAGFLESLTIDGFYGQMR